MGGQPLPPAAEVKFLGWLRAYSAHEDPAASVCNFVALVVGWNGPFYPVYLIALAGGSIAAPALLTMLATPFFLAIPLLSQRSSLAGRLGLPLIGTVNTLWCIKLLGSATAVGLFLLPCVVLATLLFRRRELPWLLFAAAVPVAARLIPDAVFDPPLIALSAAATARVASLNIGSVATLTVLLVLQIAGLLRRLEPV